ncbi:MAG: hypothetical protein WBF93_15035, partial [Pirellulales bacterium]
GGDGDIDNTATVSSDQLPNESDSEDVPIAQNPAYTIIKTVTDVGGDGASGLVDAAGDLITYQIVVINTGNQSVTGVSLSDPLLQGANGTLSGEIESLTNDDILEVGETWTYTGTYTVQQSDIDDNGGGDGDIDNTATVSSTELPDESDSEDVPIDQNPAYAIDKTVTDVDGGGPMGEVDAAGDVISYQVQVVNTGNQTITGVTLADTLVAMVGSATESGGTGVNGDGNLDVGETWTWTYTYVVTQTDINTNGGGDGDIDNTAIVSSDQLPEEDDSETVPVVTPGEIAGMKFWDRNSNGVRDVGGEDGYVGNADDEIGLSGWVIVVFEDTNGNQLLDQDEFDAGEFGFQPTDANGNYLFTDVPAGDYIVVEVLQTAWLQSHPMGASVLAPGLDDDGAQLGAKGHAIVVQGGQTNDDNDFGNFKIGKHLTLASAQNWTDQEFDLSQGDIWFPIEPGSADQLLATIHHASGLAQLDLYDSEIQFVSSAYFTAQSQDLYWTRDTTDMWYLRLYGTSPSAWLDIYQTIHRDGDTVYANGTSYADNIQFHATDTDYLVKLNGVEFWFSANDVSNFVIDGGPGDDQIDVWGNSDDEVARLYPFWGMLDGSNYHVSFHDFSTISVDSMAGHDVALMYDSVGNEMFYGRPESAEMIGVDFHNQVSGFEQVVAHAWKGGTDRAMLYDSIGKDILIAKPTYSILSDTASNYYNVVKGFDYVDAFATAGGSINKAYLYDSPVNDIFVGAPTYARLADVGNTFVNTAHHFNRVHAFATAGGGDDRAYLHDSDGSDFYYGRDNYGLMRRSDYQYYNVAWYFNHIEATASNGYDRAYLYGTSDTNHLTLGETHTSLSSGDVHYRTSGFNYSRVYGRGGYDYV